jgi:hypothetical protein
METKMNTNENRETWAGAIRDCKTYVDSNAMGWALLQLLEVPLDLQIKWNRCYLELLTQAQQLRVVVEEVAVWVETSGADQAKADGEVDHD